jgi:hypothetical protein
MTLELHMREDVQQEVFRSSITVWTSQLSAARDKAEDRVWVCRPECSSQLTYYEIKGSMIDISTWKMSENLR